MNYEIQDGVLLIYLQGSSTPSLYQPTWPNGEPWGEGEAASWAEQFILAKSDETADLPGDGPHAPTKARILDEVELTEET